MIFKKCFAICLCFQALFENYLLYPFVSVQKNASKKELILFTFSLYFFFLFRSLFVCLLVMFAQWFLQFSHVLLTCCDVLKKKGCFLYHKLKRTSHHFPSQKFPGRIFFFSSFSILFHSIQAFFANKETFCFFYLVCIFRKKLLLFFKKKESLSWKKFSFLLSSSVSCILVSSLFCFCASSFAFIFISVFAWSFVFLISFFLNSFFLYFTFNFLWTTISPSSCINKKKLFKYSLFTCMGCLVMSF